MLIDAHNHLHDARLVPYRAAIFAELARLGVTRAVVNGTRESDWPAVAELAREKAWVLPSFGLHPWQVAGRSANWLVGLREHLDAHADAAIGEIGLDRWITGHDPAEQHTVFTAQLALAAERNLPATLHCVRAWGPLWEIIRTQPVPACGFLLHAYSGSAEMVPGFLKRGAYFSFNAYFLHERKVAARAIFARLPADRVLVETDAPDLAPPARRNPHPLEDPNDQPINDPANLAFTYATLSDLRSVPLAELTAQVAENFARLFARN